MAKDGYKRVGKDAAAMQPKPQSKCPARGCLGVCPTTRVWSGFDGKESKALCKVCGIPFGKPAGTSGAATAGGKKGKQPATPKQDKEARTLRAAAVWREAAAAEILELKKQLADANTTAGTGGAMDVGAGGSEADAISAKEAEIGTKIARFQHVEYDMRPFVGDPVKGA